MAAAGDDVLMVDGEAGDPGPARRLGQEVLIIAHGHIRLEPVHEVQNLAQIAAGMEPDLKAGPQGGGDVHPVAANHRGRIGALDHGELPPQNGGPGIVAEKKKLVPGKMPGKGQGPDGVAVSDAVDAIKNSGHSVKSGSAGEGFHDDPGRDLHGRFLSAHRLRMISRTRPPQVIR